MSPPSGAAGTARLSVGAIVRETFRLLAAHPRALAGVMVPTAVLFLIGNAANEGVHALNPMLELAGTVPPPEQPDPGAAMASLGCALLGFLAQAIAFAGIAQATPGGRGGDGIAGMGTHLTRALPRVPAVLGCGVVFGIAVAIGTVLFIVPGLYLASMLFVVGPVVVLEGAGVAAFGRSAALTRGRRWPLVGLLLLYGLCALGVNLVGLILHYALAVAGTSVVFMTMSALVTLGIDVIILATAAVLPVLTYLHLRGDDGDAADGDAAKADAAKALRDGDAAFES